MTPLPVRFAPRWFRPRSFLCGLGAGLAALSALGWRVSHLDYHPHFLRFCPEISPEGSYYPTVAEMGAIVRSKSRPDQVLVVVGGNSIFQGVGQPVAELWTRRLQELLGARYCVVNLAFRGAYASDGGAVVAEVLHRGFPRQIYVANAGSMTCMDPTGSDPYRFIFWEAYFKGLLLPFAPRTDYVHRRFYRPWTGLAPMVDVAGKAWLDRLLHFDDFWNYVTVDWFNTVPSIFHPDLPAVFAPRGRYADDEPDARGIPFEKRYQPAEFALEMQIVRGGTEPYYQRGPDGQWVLDTRTQDYFDYMDRAAMPEQLRERTLIVVSQNSPYYLDRLDAAERTREQAGYRDSVTSWRDAGYQAITYPAGLSVDDYADRTHLTATGGRKLAASVAAEVRQMAGQLGYLESVPGRP